MPICAASSSRCPCSPPPEFLAELDSPPVSHLNWLSVAHFLSGDSLRKGPIVSLRVTISSLEAFCRMTSTGSTLR